MAKNKSVEDEEDLEDDEDSDAEGADKEDGEDEDQKKVDDEDGEDDEPKTRSNLSHIIARKNRKIENLSRKLEKKGDDEDEDEDEDDGDIEDKVGRAVRKNIAPIAKDLDDKQVSLEISTFLANPKNTRFAKYERQARRYALHPAYQNVPIDGIFKQLAFDDVDAADDEGNRRARAEKQSVRGGSFRQAPASDADKIKRMQFRDKDFGAIRARIGAGETINLEEE